MAWCRESNSNVSACSDIYFKDEYKQSEEPKRSGIYRCVGCGNCSLEIVHFAHKPLPHHHQKCGTAPLWRLIVFPDHPDFPPLRSLRRK